MYTYTCIHIHVFNTCIRHCKWCRSCLENTNLSRTRLGEYDSCWSCNCLGQRFRKLPLWSLHTLQGFQESSEQDFSVLQLPYSSLGSGPAECDSSGLQVQASYSKILCKMQTRSFRIACKDLRLRTHGRLLIIRYCPRSVAASSFTRRSWIERLAESA